MFFKDNDGGREFLEQTGAGSKNRNTRTKRPQGKLGRCLNSVNTLINKYGSVTAKGTKRIAQKTKLERGKHMRGFVKRLHKLGYKVENVKNIRNNHVQAVVDSWVEQGMAAATMQTYLSHVRTMMTWAGKPGMVLSPERYVKDPSIIKRTYSTTTLIGPFENKIDLVPSFRIVGEKQPEMLIQLLLMLSFGMRPREAWMFKPNLSDMGDWVWVESGAKGGRYRKFPVRCEFQRTVLDMAKTYSPSKNASTTPKTYDMARWATRWSTVVRRAAGLDRKNRCHPHSLRHQYASDVYELLTGHKAPISLDFDPKDYIKTVDRIARLEVARELGHERIQISTSYIGGYGDDFSDAPIVKRDPDTDEVIGPENPELGRALDT